MKTWECVKKFGNVRGFAYAPPFGPHGIDQWIIGFDADVYRYGIQKGKEHFPSFNTVVVTLSFEAWCSNRTKFLENLNTAFTILKEENIQAVTRYFNSCFGVPSFGGYTAESVQPNMVVVYRKYMQDCLKVLADKKIILHDISNEPLNNTYGSRFAQNRIYDFIAAMHEEIVKADDRPITVGTQGYFDDDPEEMRQGWLTARERHSEEPVRNDIAFFWDLMDVVTLHPYNIENLPQEEFEAKFQKKLDRLEELGKPVLITECCWGAVDEEGRKSFLESELTTYKKCGIGFSCHVLLTSQVADCYPFDENTVMTHGLYMAFLDKDYNVRKYHDIFND